MDGCDFWPDGSWKLCCDIHDHAFELGGGFSDWFNANWNLVTCVAQHDWFNAGLMGFGLFALSASFYRWKWLGGRSPVEIIIGKEYGT